MSDLAGEQDAEGGPSQDESVESPPVTSGEQAPADLGHERLTDVEAQPDEAGCDAAAGASEVAAQVSQDALFTVDLAPAVQPVPGDEGVTAFGGAPDDLEAIRTELGAGEEQEAVQTDAEPPVPETLPAAETAADAEAGAGIALAEAGVPEGQDDDADAVEALLDEEAAEGLLEPPDRTLSVPFFVYDGVWLVFAIAMVVALRDAAVAGALDTAPAYPMFVLVALVLTVVGPLLAVFLWWLRRSHAAKGERTGLLASALLRGALATFAGVAMWTLARVVLDYLRTGRFF
ncbi:MAG TPA: hypothetical protein VGK50_04705 [Coriobacteriia bacterium]|jgi:hypothetical protein